MFIDRSCSQVHSNVRFMGRSVEFVNSVDLLGVLLYADLKVNHIHRNVQEFYRKDLVYRNLSKFYRNFIEIISICLILKTYQVM